MNCCSDRLNPSLLFIGGITQIILQIYNETEINNLKKKDPLHVRSGTNDDWKKYFSNDHLQIYKEIASSTLKRWKISEYEERY
jgi:hypothetical protein